ncbi:MAG: hypothetical protein Q8P26_01300 [Candidatus Levybacteria bacterium]|nr:hypothetical protein [Candidatus Levybacteria bacterium]
MSLENTGTGPIKDSEWTMNYQLLKKLKTRYEKLGLSVRLSDALLVREEDVLTKIPVKSCWVEVFILNKIKQLGIPTVSILGTGAIGIDGEKLPYYRMNFIPNAKLITDLEEEALNSDYYQFLETVFNGLQTVTLDGYGSITGFKKGKPMTKHGTLKRFFMENLQNIKNRNYWQEDRLDKLALKIEDQPLESNAGFLTHNDIFNNILVSKTKSKSNFYIIDPQTSVSSANQYWDLASYLVYTNGYGYTRGLDTFLARREITNWKEFMLTIELIILERASFYATYDSSRVAGMTKMLEFLDRGMVLVGQTVFSEQDFKK